jgi:hypothetical protein
MPRITVLSERPPDFKTLLLGVPKDALPHLVDFPPSVPADKIELCFVMPKQEKHSLTSNMVVDVLQKLAPNQIHSLVILQGPYLFFLPKDSSVKPPFGQDMVDQLTSEFARALYRHIDSVEKFACHIDGEDLTRFVRMLAGLPNLREATIKCWFLFFKCTPDLFTALASLNHLEMLNVIEEPYNGKYRDAEPDPCHFFEHLMGATSSITCLSLTLRFSAAYLDPLSRILPSNPSLRKLTITLLPDSSGRLDQREVASIAGGLQQNSTLEVLSFQTRKGRFCPLAPMFLKSLVLDFMGATSSLIFLSIGVLKNSDIPHVVTLL